MKTLQIYVCEVCGYTSEDKELVEACESSSTLEELRAEHPQLKELPAKVTLVGKYGEHEAIVTDLYIQSEGYSEGHDLGMVLDREVLLGTYFEDQSDYVGECSVSHLKE